jgi:hypothetical protein
MTHLLHGALETVGAMGKDLGMTFSDWSEPVRLMEEQSGPVADEQLELGTQLGLVLMSDLPRGVAAVMLEEHLRPRIWGLLSGKVELATEKQLKFLEAIAHDRAWKRVSLSKHVASAWIDHYLTVRNAEVLRELRLRAGDRVVHERTWVDHNTGELQAWSDCYVVSSIGARGLVYFKGGNGKCAWPSRLSRSDDS